MFVNYKLILLHVNYYYYLINFDKINKFKLFNFKFIKKYAHHIINMIILTLD